MYMYLSATSRERHIIAAAWLRSMHAQTPRSANFDPSRAVPQFLGRARLRAPCGSSSAGYFGLALPISPATVRRGPTAKLMLSLLISTRCWRRGARGRKNSPPRQPPAYVWCLLAKMPSTALSAARRRHCYASCYERSCSLSASLRHSPPLCSPLLPLAPCRAPSWSCAPSRDDCCCHINAWEGSMRRSRRHAGTARCRSRRAVQRAHGRSRLSLPHLSLLQPQVVRQAETARCCSINARH